MALVEALPNEGAHAGQSRPEERIRANRDRTRSLMPPIPIERPSLETKPHQEKWFAYEKEPQFPGILSVSFVAQLPSIEVSHLPDVIMFAAGIALFMRL